MTVTPVGRGKSASARPDRARGSPAEPGPRVTLTAELLTRRYVEQGVGAEQIAAETGWSAQFVRDRLRDHGIPLRRPGITKDNVDPATISGWVEEGLSVPEMAARAGYSRRGMYVLLHRLRLPTPTATVSASQRDLSLPAEYPQTVVRLYRDQQLSLAQVGAAFGHGPDWARARLVAAGVPIRRGGARPRRPARNEPDVARLAGWYADGLTLAQVAARAGMSRNTVTAAFRAHGVQIRGRHPGSTTPTSDQLRELYVDQHRTLAQVAAELGCSSRRVAAGLAAAGVALRPAGAPACSPPLEPAQLHELYTVQQLSLAEIAAQLGGSDNRVREALKKHGIPRRRGGTRPTAPLDLDAATLHQLYVDQHLEDNAIAARYHVPTWRVTRRRRELGVTRPPVPPPHPAQARAPTAAVLRQLYLDQGLPVAVIAQRYHTAAPKVRRWLEEAGIAVRPRTTREQRTALDPAKLRELYTDREWTAAEIAAELDIGMQLVLRALHENGIPVRRAGTRRTRRRPDPEPVGTRLLADLYADPEITTVLRRHRIPRRPRPGPIATRFPKPAALTTSLLLSLYQDVGLSARQIELLTGQPHEQILDALHGHGIAVRDRAGFGPWTIRQR